MPNRKIANKSGKFRGEKLCVSVAPSAARVIVIAADFAERHELAVFRVPFNRRGAVARLQTQRATKCVECRCVGNHKQISISVSAPLVYRQHWRMLLVWLLGVCCVGLAGTLCKYFYISKGTC